MAKIETIQLVDDLTGEPGDETVQFAVDGKPLEVDLSEKNAKALRDALAPYVAVARRASGARQPRRPSSATDRQANTEVREWARKNGIKIADRGRIPEVVTMAYREGRPELARG